MKNVITNEIWPWNEFYGLSHVLKEYAGYEDDYRLKCVATHGIGRYSINDSLEYKQNLPVYLTCSTFEKYRIQQLRDSEVKVYSMAPWILYAKSLYDETQINIKKKELGKNLLVLPSHSTNWLNLKSNVDGMAQEIIRIKDEYKFDSVTICLYWLDILKGLDKTYKSYGFNILCAGYMIDSCFLRRLRALIELSDVAMGNGYTSAMWYAASLGKPFYLWNDNSMDCIEIIKTLKDSIPEVFSAFGEYNESFTNEQMGLIEKYCDIKSFKSPSELHSIFEESERLYKEGNYKKYQGEYAYRY
ncbi:MAG: hypothetical protein LBU84_06535 [Prevotella sp.]|nr:hypothetical protein [Prevotella sp.]